MKETPERQEATSPTPDYILLGQILRKERSAQKQEAVDAVLRSPSNTAQKIERIKLIDRLGERPERRRLRSRPSAPRPEPEIAFDNDADQERGELLLVRRNQSLLKRRHSENRMLVYVFRDYAKIKRFALQSGMLEFRFPFSLRLSRHAMETLATEYQLGRLKEAIAVLESLVQGGWDFLEKFEYNSVVAFLDFCRSLMDAGFLSLPRGDRNLLQRFGDLERCTLILLSDRRIRDAVFIALEKAADTTHSRAEEFRACEDQLRRLTAESANKPTLGNLFLALNMMRWRRYFVLPDLTNAAPGRLVSDAAFDCSDKIRLAINGFIDDREADLARLIRDRAAIQKERAFLPVDSKGEADYGPLARFYDEQAGPGSGGVFRQDGDRVLVLLARLAALYVKDFRTLFCGPLAFEPSGNGFLFDPSVFGPDFDKLAHAVGKLERHASSFGSLTRQRFLEIRSTGKTATRIEAEGYSLAAEVLAVLRALVQKLVLRLSERGIPFSAVAIPEADASDVASTPESDRARMFGRTVRGERVVAGKTALEALRYAAGIAYAIGLHLSDPALWALIKRDAELKKELEGILKTVERLAPKQVFAEIRKRYVVL